jgi:alpha-tubulin suppressor-like RCC1 family protein
MLTARRRWLAGSVAWVSCAVLISGCAGLFSGGGTRHAQTSAMSAPPPVLASSAGAHVASIGAGGFSGYAVLGDGHVWAWGDGIEGQIGRDGAQSIRTTPVQVRGLAGVIAIAGGANTAYALRRGGSVWAWGDDGENELGDAGGRPRTRPVQIHVPGRFVAIAGGMFAAYALRRDGTVWSWGENAVGQLGSSIAHAASGRPLRVGLISRVIAIGAGAGDGYALRREGTVWAWGEDSLGQLGSAGCTATEAAGPGGPHCPAPGVPVRVRGLDRVKAIAVGANTAYALRRDGTVWAWGDNSFGALGAGRRSLFVRRPVRVAGLADVTAIGAGANTAYAVMGDGSIEAWGRGADGELGNGSFADRGLPTRVLGVDGAVQVAAGGAMGYALDRRGRLWAWGSGFYGQLGNGTRLTLARPTLVLGLSRLAS